jgi:spore coat protein CotH
MFDPSRLHEVRLELDPADWAALRADYWSNQYYAADVAIDGEVVRQIGIRSRGSGSRSGAKPGLKLDFNRYVNSQQFHGYKNVVLDNGAQDASGLRERLAFLVFEAMGIAAPRLAHARLVVNGEPWGLYTLVEPVSGHFLGERFGENEGNLFDYTWTKPYHFEYLGDGPEAYVPLPFQPDNNRDDVDASGLVAFIRAINLAPTPTFVEEISAYVDPRRVLTYVATENALAEYDGFAGYAGANNFYLYQFAGQRRFVLVPWDKDTSLSAAEWPLDERLDTNVLTRRLMEDPALRAFYVSEVRRAVTSFVNPRWLGLALEMACEQVREAALADDKKPYSNADFEDAVAGLRGVIAAREADVLRQAP